MVLARVGHFAPSRRRGTRLWLSQMSRRATGEEYASARTAPTRARRRPCFKYVRPTRRGPPDQWPRGTAGRPAAVSVGDGSARVSHWSTDDAVCAQVILSPEQGHGRSAREPRACPRSRHSCADVPLIATGCNHEVHKGSILLLFVHRPEGTLRRSRVTPAATRRSSCCEPGVNLLNLRRRVFDLDLRAAAIPAAEIEDDRRVVGAAWRELSSQ